jgi:unsaturated rhamnogalacturonyl hydrolase
MQGLVKRSLCVGLAVGAGVAIGQAKPKPVRTVPAANTASDPVLERALRQWPDAMVDTVKRPGEWTYEEGVLLDGVLAEWRVTGDGRLFKYVKAAIDRSVEKDGTVLFGEKAPFPVKEHSLDNIEMGRATLSVYRVTGDERYYKAVKFLHDQMKAQPKNSAGGYWHKQIYPNQMWLDGAYMAEPFMEGYGKTFNDQKSMDEAVAQLLLMDQRMRDHKTGLMKHGWDPSLKMDWVDKESGLSPEFWGRSMGWYAMAVVDVLERMPAADPQRLALEDVAQRLLTTIVHYQDPASGLWWQVLDKGGQQGNYLEASVSCMFVYAMAKGVRLGVAPMTLVPAVMKGWTGIQKKFVKSDGTLSGTVKVAGLGGKPYRSGTYEYYVGEEVGDNDAKGVGSYLMALSEVTQIQHAGELLRRARGKTVLVDAWFNSQTRKLPEGGPQLYHYKWNDDANSGYSAWGHMFQQYGMHTEMLDHAPRAEDLKGVKIYVIASPDIPALNPKTHFMDEESAAAIEAWVKAGGVLVFMQNDPAHADQTHFNLLSDRFGIHYNVVDVNAQVGDDYSTTMVPIAAGMGGIFHHAHRALMKDTCTITASGKAKPILTFRGNTFMSVAHVGRGLVYANVDPWIYNEYTDGRRSPLDEDNFAAGVELTRWLVTQALAR